MTKSSLCHLHAGPNSGRPLPVATRQLFLSGATAGSFFVSQSVSWNLSDGWYVVSSGGNTTANSIRQLQDPLPSEVNFSVTHNTTLQGGPDRTSNAYVIFDYLDTNSFKFAVQGRRTIKELHRRGQLFLRLPIRLVDLQRRRLPDQFSRQNERHQHGRGC